MKSKSENKKHLIFRNLILFLTILVCIFIAVLAWFSSLTEATASGLTVKSTTGEGLEIAFEDVDTAYSTQGITLENTHELPLITSNGIYNSTTLGENFFLPMLDRSVGSPLLNSDNTWAVKRTAEAGRDYIEADVYFRSKEHLTVSLGGDSAAEPATETGVDIPNKSPFGEFSKNNIAGASRVGFYDASDNLKFIWAPNSTYELSQGGNYTEIQLTEDTSRVYTTFNPGGTPAQKWWTDLIDAESGVDITTNYKLYYYDYTDTKALQSVDMYWDNNNNVYVGVVDVNDYTIDYMIGIFKDESSIGHFANGKDGDNSWVAYTNGLFNIYVDPDDTLNSLTYVSGQLNDSINEPINGVNRWWAKLYLNNDNYNNTTGDYNHWQFKIIWEGPGGCLKLEDVILYKDADNYIASDGIKAIIGDGKTKYIYKLDTTKSMLITGVSDGTRYGLAVSNNSLTTKSVCSASTTQIPYVSSEFLFQPVAGSAANTYKLMHITTGKYLVIDSGGSLALSANETEFTLSVGANGPLLSMNGWYIGFAGGKITPVHDLNTAISIFQGNAYTFTSSGTAQTSYSYLERGGTAEASLARATAAVTSIDALSSTPIVDNLSYISNVPIVTLTKDETSGYYKGHIKVRIWIEGTDREAKTPLQGGKFKTTLSFIGAKVDETASS